MFFKQVWSFAPPPEELPPADFFSSASTTTTTPLSSSSSPRTHSPATISPYEDPTAAADSSSSNSHAHQHRSKSRLQYEESLAQQQDEIMTEAYDTSHMLGSELEDGGGPILESDLRD